MGSRLDVNNEPNICISLGRKKQASHWILTTSLLFGLPETRYRWAQVEEFTISLLFALQNGRNNRNRVNSQSLSLVLEKAMAPHSSTLAWKNIHLKVIVMAIVKLILMARIKKAKNLF